MLGVLNVLDVLNALNMPMDASLACWALFSKDRCDRSGVHDATIELWYSAPALKNYATRSVLVLLITDKWSFWVLRVSV